MTWQKVHILIHCSEALFQFSLCPWFRISLCARMPGSFLLPNLLSFLLYLYPKIGVTHQAFLSVVTREIGLKVISDLFWLATRSRHKKLLCFIEIWYTAFAVQVEGRWQVLVLRLSTEIVGPSALHLVATLSYCSELKSCLAYILKHFLSFYII